MENTPWRVEWHECGWSSRYIVVRGYGPEYKVLNSGYTNKKMAEEKAEELNRSIPDLSPQER